MTLIEDIKSIYDKSFQVGGINIDNLVCKLHYRVTVTVLVLFSFLLSLGQVRIHFFYLRSSPVKKTSQKVRPFSGVKIWGHLYGRGEGEISHMFTFILQHRRLLSKMVHKRGRGSKCPKICPHGLWMYPFKNLGI